MIPMNESVSTRTKRMSVKTYNGQIIFQKYQNPDNANDTEEGDHPY